MATEASVGLTDENVPGTEPDVNVAATAGAARMPLHHSKSKSLMIQTSQLPRSSRQPPELQPTRHRSWRLTVIKDVLLPGKSVQVSVTASCHTFEHSTSSATPARLQRTAIAVMCKGH